MGYVASTGGGRAVIAISHPYTNQLEAIRSAASLDNATLIVTGKHVEIIEEAPPPPYTTGTLLEDATTCLNCSADQVMRLAQFLFEGIELYGAHTGLITYHRTDSILIALETQVEAREVIAKLFGKDALPPHLPKYRTPSVGNGEKPGIRAQRLGFRSSALLGYLTKWIKANRQLVFKNLQSPIINQQSHEAIRPTSPKRLPDRMTGILDDATLALYKLIWERFIASQMKAALHRVTTIDLEVA
jgi:DNA topoisomerase I